MWHHSKKGTSPVSLSQIQECFELKTEKAYQLKTVPGYSWIRVARRVWSMDHHKDNGETAELFLYAHAQNDL